jgi:hypothetical protein
MVGKAFQKGHQVAEVASIGQAEARRGDPEAMAYF